MIATLTLTYDPSDSAEAARVASIVRGDDRKLRRAAWELRERLRCVRNGKDAIPGLSAAAAEVVLRWITDEFGGVELGE